ncbi:CBN-MADD-2 protein, partial [Aphelenchoides avenae]
SRPSSFIGGLGPSTSRLPSILTPSTSGYSIVCEACQKPSFFSDETTVRHLRENVALRKLLQRFRGAHEVSTPSASGSDAPTNIYCEWCEGAPNPVTTYCTECTRFYCPPCLPLFHPSRGPLKDHKMLPANSAICRRLLPSAPEVPKETECDCHPQEVLTMYCAVCRVPLCCQCLQDVRHANHDVQSLSTAVKAQK